MEKRQGESLVGQPKEAAPYERDEENQNKNFLSY
jgi:hypothetical protein